ncbi:MAG TPA: hypothetical protein VMU69_09380 [Bradyrhizobium sp.]|nr:hypothetical protein [Bradyrhizobium sp.]
MLDVLHELRTREFVAALEEQRAQGQKNLERPNWLWDALIGSAATLGRVPCLCILESKRAKYQWHAVESLDDSKLEALVLDIYTEAGVRFRNRKSAWAGKNRRLICDEGGPDAVKRRWLGLPVKEACNYLARFAGVSSKYARNIGMDVARTDFMDTAALDWRLLTILRRVNPALPPIRGKGYLEIEAYARKLACCLRISLWEFDRTLFSKYEALKDRLDIRDKDGGRRRRTMVNCGGKLPNCPYAAPVVRAF